MATQTGSIDLEATYAAKLYAQAGFDNAAQTYATKSELTVSADNIKAEVSETYATKDEAQPTNTGSGAVISTDDCAALPPVGLTVWGNSTQDGTPTPSAPVEIDSIEAQNLQPYFSHDFNDVYNASTNPNGYWRHTPFSAGDTQSDVYPTATQLEDGWAHVEWSGTVSRRQLVSVSPVKPKDGSIKASTSYTILMEIRNYSASGTNINLICPAVQGSVSVWSSTVYQQAITEDGSYYYPAVTKADISTADQVRTFLVACNGVSASTTFSLSFDIRLSLYEGVYLREYVPFGSLCVVATGKNIAQLIQSSNFVETNGEFSGTAAGIFTMFGNVSTSRYLLRSPLGAFPPTLTVSLEAYTNGNSSTSGNGLIVVAKNHAGDLRKYLAVIPNSTSEWTLFTGSLEVEDAETIGISYASGGANNWHIRNFCIRLDGSTEYTPYQGTTLPIDLQGNALRSLPDGTKDELQVAADGSVTLVQRVGSVDMGSLSWSKFNNVFYAILNTMGNTETTRVMCESYASSTRTPSNASDANNWLTDFQVAASYGASQKYIYAKDSTYADGAAFKTGVNGVCLWYPLATPQTIDLGSVSLPNLPSPDMSMWVDGTTIDAEWWTMNGYETGSVTYRASTLEQDVNGLTLELSGKVDSDEPWVSWMHAGTDPTTHEPYLSMGQDSDYPSVVYGGSAARFYDGEGDAASNVVAEFGAGGARIGRIGAAHQTQTSTQSLIYGPDGELVIVTKYQPITDSVSGDSKYGTRITDEGNMSYIDIFPAVSSSGFNDRLNLSAYMNNVDLSTTSGSELHLDNTYASIGAMETVSGTTYENGLTLGFDSQNGYAPKISFSGTGAQAAWLAALGLTVQEGAMTYASGLNSSYGSAPVRKWGSIGILKLNSVRLASQLASGGSVVIGTLPTGYLPVGSVDMHIDIESNSSNYRNNYIVIEYSGSTNPGRVTLYNRSGYAIPNTVTFSCTCPFFIG